MLTWQPTPNCSVHRDLSLSNSPRRKVHILGNALVWVQHMGYILYNLLNIIHTREHKTKATSTGDLTPGAKSLFRGMSWTLSGTTLSSVCNERISTLRTSSASWNLHQHQELRAEFTGLIDTCPTTLIGLNWAKEGTMFVISNDDCWNCCFQFSHVYQDIDLPRKSN